ncbi:MAG: hypothetical protein J5932_07420, partial [Prevotella sp.]|nr:hypothetical protein [Prevotella sp.]
MNIKNLKHYIIVIAILFGISPFVTSIYANINLFQMTSLVPNNEDEEDEEDEDEEEEEDEEGGKAFCDCKGSGGVCIKQELLRNGGKAKPGRLTYESEVMS